MSRELRRSVPTTFSGQGRHVCSRSARQHGWRRDREPQDPGVPARSFDPPAHLLPRPHQEAPEAQAGNEAWRRAVGGDLLGAGTRRDRREVPAAPCRLRPRITVLRLRDRRYRRHRIRLLLRWRTAAPAKEDGRIPLLLRRLLDRWIDGSHEGDPCGYIDSNSTDDLVNSKLYVLCGATARWRRRCAEAPKPSTRRSSSATRTCARSWFAPCATRTRCSSWRTSTLLSSREPMRLSLPVSPTFLSPRTCTSRSSSTSTALGSTSPRSRGCARESSHTAHTSWVMARTALRRRLNGRRGPLPAPRSTPS